MPAITGAVRMTRRAGFAHDGHGAGAAASLMGARPVKAPQSVQS
jgi:hypothetical protein